MTIPVSLLAGNLWGQMFEMGGTGGTDFAAVRQQRMEQKFKAADTDGNGSLSKAEFATLYNQIQLRLSGMGAGGGLPSVDDLFKTADTDGDGAVSQDELLNLFKKLHEQMLQANGNGQTTSAEAIFKTSDTDGDGTISQGEFAALLQKLGTQANGMGRHLLQPQSGSLINLLS